MELMRTQSSETGVMRYRKMWHTDIPSIQGPWTPWEIKSPQQNLIVYPDEASSKAIQTELTATEKLIEIFKQQQLSKKDEVASSSAADGATVTTQSSTTS